MKTPCIAHKTLRQSIRANQLTYQYRQQGLFSNKHLKRREQQNDLTRTSLREKTLLIRFWQACSWL